VPGLGQIADALKLEIPPSSSAYEALQRSRSLVIYGQKVTMMDKPPKTKTELEALVLTELRAAPQCAAL
jgi:hypothetical protein